LYASKLPGSSNFELCLYSLDIQANSAKLVEASDLSNFPSEYHEFADIFSKTKAKILAPYHPYELQINLEEDAQPPVGPIYFQHLNKRVSRNSLRKTLIWILSN